MIRRCSLNDCSNKHYGNGYCQKHYHRARRHGDPHAPGIRGHRPIPVGERIAARTVLDGGCLMYQSKRKTRSGHVTIYRDGQYIGVHRAAWELANGPVPANLYVLHRCDRPRCVNVAHLFLGTIADNNADRDQKGRHVALRGSANGTAKLDEAAVAQIKLRLTEGESTYAVADAFGVTQSAVWLIRAGRTWKHVEPAAELAGVQWPDCEAVTAR
ncbi:HNH endonuclease signature motif containing protein [Streptomyces sp. 4F14]|uniref:HNH endonuclease signature motif containing protein n=1 Tax=Streptomyces sp. 4F14 TaxID=3394380 RepID=UPI003A8436F5